MSNTDPNLVLVFSPTGESAEVSRANARDLTSHAGWSYERLIAAATPAPAPAKAPANQVTPPPAAAAPAADETPATEGDATIFTTAEQFAGFDRDAVVAYLAKHFPDFKPHHKSSADGLIAKAIALATSEAGAEADEDEAE